ncbi:hypothetical protein V2J09_021167 [Rumex salicifolius]
MPYSSGTQMESWKASSKPPQMSKNLPRKEVFGASALHLSDQEPFNLVGNIVEKGFYGDQSLATSSSAPRPSVLPFPLARHRSHGPHWGPKFAESCEDDEEDIDDEIDAINYDPIAHLANPLKKKIKKSLDLSNWRDLVFYDCSDANTKETTKNLWSHVENQKAKIENIEASCGESMSNNLSIEKELNVKLQLDDAERIFISEMGREYAEVMDIEPSSMTSSNKDEVNSGNRKVDYTRASMDHDRTKGRVRFNSSQENMMSIGESSTSYGFDVAQKSEFVSLESQIDAENQARLRSMSLDEIAEAEEQIRDKINPKLLNLLRQRGKEKIGKHNSAKIISASSNETTKLSPSAMSSALLDTKTKLGENAVPLLPPDGGGVWDVWSKRVEAVRNIRFSLDGHVIQIEPLHSTTSALDNGTAYADYNADNVAERDFLRTEGDPAAAGYTFKEALVLTRSVIPGQRALALHLLSSVLNNALENIHQDHIGHTLNHPDSIKNFVDWEAVWAFALGPEPELALLLRLCLDDNHDSVVLACAKTIQCTLAYEWTEEFFDVSDKLTSQEKHLYTAPVFRSKPDIQGGFLHGGFWKYSAKQSNILVDNMAYGKEGGEQTIQDDNFVAVQDIVAGFVRMGILPRLCYILETNPTVALEECILSILVAIARHSPTCASAIFNCERLVQTLQHRFMLKDKREDQACKIKSVKLVRVLAQSDKRNCCEFVKNGTFERMMLNFYQGPLSLNDWLVAGKEQCKLSSELMIEQLRYWKVCIKYGHCGSYFTYFCPAICFWLNPPTVDKLTEKDVLQEYMSVAGEVYLVLGALAEKLPDWNTRGNLSLPSSDTCKDDSSSWCWNDAASLVDIALQWIVSDCDAPLYKVFDEQFYRRGWAKSLLWVISAVLHMLSTIIDRATSVDSISAMTAERRQVLLDLVSKIGLSLINSGFLRFTDSVKKDNSLETNAGVSYVEKLCQFKHHADRVMSLAANCCNHGVLRLVASIDHLIGLAKNNVLAISFKGKGLSMEERILDAGVLICSVADWKKVLCECIESLYSIKHTLQSIEVFGRGGPAPGAGIGWGVAGGGFWSLATVLVQENARLLVDLFPLVEASSPKQIPASENKAITCQKINCNLAILLSVGPRNKVIAEKALEILLQIPVMKFLNECLSNLLYNGMEVSLWEYEENDFVRFSNILTSHYRKRWLCKKRKKPKPVDGIRSPQHKPYESSNFLATIHEDVDTSAVMPEDSASLTVEWANQHLPLCFHWLLSPISAIGDGNQTTSSNRTTVVQDSMELLEIAKAGIFFLSGIEAMSSSLAEGDFSPVQSIPFIWKLHSMSMSLLSGIGVLEEERSRDIFQALQRLYGHHLDGLRTCSSTEEFRNSNMGLLSFQSEIHESYSTFVETLVEQYAAISYGDLAYGRQISIYLHRSVDARTRLSAWNALSNSHVLELLPRLDNFIAEPEGYLKPPEDDGSLLEAFLKSWVTGALDKAATRCSGTYTIALHHLSSFIFNHDNGEKLSLRNKLIKSLLRWYSRKQQHKKMMLDLLRYKYMPVAQTFCEMEDQSLQTTLSGRFHILIEACDGNCSLLSIVERLKSASSRD